MGRELRRVPPNWEHPERNHYGKKSFQPMFDRHFEDAAKEWKDEFSKWEAGERPDWFNRTESDENLEFWEWESNPPDRDYYRPWKDEEATWYQVWETVSEGTPVSPPFETKSELIDYLWHNGDFWDQRRGTGPWSRKSAEEFVNGPGFAVSFVSDEKGFRSGVEALGD